MTLQNCEIFASVLFLLVAKIVSFFVGYSRASMFNKSGSVLTSIPERNEEEEIKKWVPKKKHEVLKAKYKCLKKLFQIYDASVIGILPEPEEAEGRARRRKRSHRTKTDASAGPGELSSGDVTDMSETDKASTIATAVMRELKMTQCSYTSTQCDSSLTKNDRYAPTQVSSHIEVSQNFEGMSSRTRTNYDYSDMRKVNRCEVTEKESEGVQVSNLVQHPIPYLLVNEKPKLTRFQCFIQRIFGIKPDRSYKNLVHPNGHIYAASDNSLIPPSGEKRRRRGLRFRKLRSKPKKIQSESALRSVRSPMILTCVHSAQRSCLADTTPRQCPILGCRMIFYGIINYNDHLNLCHFTERRHVCHYCHEGFEHEHDKCLHENEHIGINKLTSSVWSRQRRASVTQTDPEPARDLPDDKLKKIVSFFDKIADPDQMLTEIKKNRYSESNLQSCKEDTVTRSTASSRSGARAGASCVSLRPAPRPARADVTPAASLACHFCGETFNYRRQLSLHVDLEHRVHDKFSKFHSCAGIINPRRRATDDSKPRQHEKPSLDTLRRKSEESLSYEPSTNIVYYTSMESVANPNPGPANYKWEPGTKIIRV